MIKDRFRRARARLRTVTGARPAQASGAVYGNVIAAPRLTWAGNRLGLRLLAIPAIVLVLALDLAVWAIAETLFGACVAIWCVL